MKHKLIAVALLALSAVSLSAVEGEQVAYYGGTMPSLQTGVIGQFDTTSGTNLLFKHPGGQVAIPYAEIQSYAYSEQIAHRLGVAPTIAVGLIKRRQRLHYLRISYKDTGGTVQVGVFEIPKTMPRTLLAILQARAPQGCKPSGSCTAHSN